MSKPYKVPPIKIHGIKMKLLSFINENIVWDGKGRWVEPFLGSGAVLFNVKPKRALVSDTNGHIIKFYQAIQQGEITPQSARMFLESEGSELLRLGDKYYYEVRERFNQSHSPLDFLFINRSCFNGLMRFNGRGKFNTPFCKKVERFRKSYITKICNQIAWVSDAMHGLDWKFVCSDWSDALSDIKPGDFIYADPPYVGRFADYYNSWSDEDATKLEATLKILPCRFLYSMWLENKYRKNHRLCEAFKGYTMKTFKHYYHIGSSEKLRNNMTEALICG